MNRKNCWEVKQCGRQPGGEKVQELGVCIAALSNRYDGVNGGNYGGRFCWAITGTLCGGNVQGTFANKLKNCLQCEFFKQVNLEEDRFFILGPKSR
jgi:hypothetical protein